MKNKTQPESYWNIFVKTGLALIVAVLISATAHAQSAPQAAAKEFTRLVNLSTALKKIPVAENEQRASHRALVKRNNKDIVYSEPAGMWFVRSDRFWDLHKKYSKLPLADQIAWGPGPRASQALMLAVRVRALLQGRLAPSIDDVIELAPPVLRHRMALTFTARAEGVTLDQVIQRLCAEVAG